VKFNEEMSMILFWKIGQSWIVKVSANTKFLARRGQGIAFDCKERSNNEMRHISG
jgi:hypothetical protein